MSKVDVKNKSKNTIVVRDYLENGDEIGVTIEPGSAKQISVKAYKEQNRDRFFVDGSLILLGESRESIETLNEMSDSDIEVFVERPLKESVPMLNLISSPGVLNKILSKTTKKGLEKEVKKRLKDLERK